MTQVTRRALLSVTDKTGIEDFARGLHGLGFAVLSTGGTKQAIAAAGVPVQEVADYTGFPEMMDGRLKTLHPKVHGGLLGVRGKEAHDAAMKQHGIDPIDVLCVNLYRFREAAKKPGAARDEIVEQIDIGGPAMIRSAAKNHAHVAVVVDPDDYGAVLTALREHGGKMPAVLLRALAAKAFAHTAAYDAAIAAWMEPDRRSAQGEPRFPERFSLAGDKVMDLRYGENPHQEAAFYAQADAVGPGLASCKQLGGKELSYNNLLDLDAALGVVLEYQVPACAIVKHNNPCGVAAASVLERAFELALQSDPVSAFGGILAMNRKLDAATARAIVAAGTFVEAIVAPEVDGAAVEALQAAKWGQNVRVLSLGGMPGQEARAGVRVRQVSGGFLLQTPDDPAEPPAENVVTSRKPTAAERTALQFAWKACKHVKSNAIVLARGTDDGAVCTVGIGAGQMSRVDSVKIACEKAGPRARGAVLASDAFFPFPDGVEAAAKAGVVAVIQPGGSKKDAEVVAAAEKAGMAMVLTGRRHFRH